MILNESAVPTLEKFLDAHEEESSAIKALSNALKSGVNDEKTLMSLTEKMTKIHNEKMNIWDQLENLKLDK